MTLSEFLSCGKDMSEEEKEALASAVSELSMAKYAAIRAPGICPSCTLHMSVIAELQTMSVNGYSAIQIIDAIGAAIETVLGLDVVIGIAQTPEELKDLIKAREATKH